jgi:hypothetical protein
MKSDINGCSTCPVGQEQWEEFNPSWRDGTAIQYDYRHTNGRLFSTVAPTLEVARARRDEWFKQEADLEDRLTFGSPRQLMCRRAEER